jgi:hypothetical protein
VEVDHATALVFSDLGKRDSDLGGQGLVRQSGLAGDGSAQGDGETAPQFRGAGIEQDRAGVVVAVRAQRPTQPVIVAGVPVRAGQAPAMRADLAAPPGMAALELAVFLPVEMDWPERGRGQGGEHARVAGDAAGDALAARQPGADQLVGVGAVHLRARWAARSAAGLARDRQHPAGLVDGRITVQQFPGGAVDVIDAPAQQDGLDAPSRRPDGASGEGKDGHRWCSSRRGGRAEADLWPGAEVSDV